MQTLHSVSVLFAAILFGLAIPAFAQPPDSLWSRTFGGGADDRMSCVIECRDSCLILIGFSVNPYTGNTDGWMIRTDTDGNMQWQRKYHGSYSQYTIHGQEILDGGYVLAGFLRSNRLPTTHFHDDFFLARTDSRGVMIWSKYYGGPYDDRCYYVQQLPEEGFILVGYVGTDGNQTDGWIVKTNTNGDTMWTHRFGDSERNEFFCGQQTSDGGYVLAGQSWLGWGQRSDFWLVRTNEAGDEQWSRTYGGYDNETCRSVFETSDGGFILGGTTRSFGAGSADIWLLKTDSEGDSLWSRTHGLGRSETCFSMRRTLDLGYLISGTTYSFDDIHPGVADGWILRVNMNGDSLWSVALRGWGTDVLTDGIQTAAGSYMTTGNTDSWSAGGYDGWLVKFAPESMAEPLNSPLPIDFALFQNYPNPSNPNTKIAYKLKKAGHISLRVFDLLGRELQILVDDMQSAGTYLVTFDGSGLPSGIYFYRLQVGDFVKTKKMVLLK